MEPRRGKIVVVSVPLHGHAIPALKLASTLHERGHKVTYISSASSTKRVKTQYPELEMISLNDRIEEMACRVKPHIWFAEIMTWCGELKRIVQEIQPDVIVTDMMTLPAARVANELGIKLVANLPMPIEMCDFFGLPSFANTVNFFGLTILTYKLKYLLMTLFVRETKDSSILYSTKSVILINTFFGLEEARSLPPNIKLVGPLKTKQLTEPKPLEKDLEEWLEKMRTKKKTVVYVTFGSLVELSAEFIADFYAGVKLTDYAYIWSLRNGELPEPNEDVFIRPWLPQAELLKLPEVRAVISHCGWGGVLECIDAAKPILAVPEFGDQPMNAEKVVARKIGLALYIPSQLIVLPDSLTVAGGRFRPVDLKNKLSELINNPVYTENVQRLRKLSLHTPGLEGACDEIEQVVENGYEHIVDLSIRKIQSQNSFFGNLLRIGLVAGLAYLAYRYVLPLYGEPL